MASMHALVANSRLFIIRSPLKPLKYHGFPAYVMVYNSFQFA
jgi:hypothetical protein